MDDPAAYERAMKRVDEIKGFYLHLLMYVLVNVLLIAIDLLTSPGTLWFYWPLLGWGIGIVAHGAAVSGGGGLWGDAWKERKIRQLMEKERRRVEN